MRSKRSVGALAVLLAALVLWIAGCGGSGSGSGAAAQATATATATATRTPFPTVPPGTTIGAEVDVAAASFVQTTATIRAGQAVRFVDPASTGGPHNLCLGKNQVCDPQAQGPVAFQNGGMRLFAGDPDHVVIFAMPGTYAITCTLHPLMNLVVTVRA